MSPKKSASESQLIAPVSQVKSKEPVLLRHALLIPLVFVCALSGNCGPEEKKLERSDRRPEVLIEHESLLRTGCGDRAKDVFMVIRIVRARC